jgi:hypothetical protein
MAYEKNRTSPESCVAASRSWFIVIPQNASDSAQARLAYPNESHALAVAQANNYEYPSIGPWSVVRVIE